MIDIILGTKEDAEKVISTMKDIIDGFDFVSVGDLKSLVGIPSTHKDEKEGWTEIINPQIRQVPKGYLLVLSQPQPLQH